MKGIQNMNTTINTNSKTTLVNRNSYDIKREIMLLFAKLENVDKMEDGKAKDLALRQLDDKLQGLANFFARPAAEVASELAWQDKRWYDRMERCAKEDKHVAEQLEAYKTATANLGYIYMR